MLGTSIGGAVGSVVSTTFGITVLVYLLLLGSKLIILRSTLLVQDTRCEHGGVPPERKNSSSIYWYDWQCGIIKFASISRGRTMPISACMDMCVHVHIAV